LARCLEVEWPLFFALNIATYSGAQGWGSGCTTVVRPQESILALATEMSI